MVEHRLKELFRIAHRVIALNFGAKIADGHPRTMMENEAVKAAYLGSEEEEEDA
jgi:ABC-type branched-subunit amino acid transport system ATPase component